VRDLLYIEDLLDAYDAAVTQIDQAAGHVYNVGGGAENQLSIWCEFAPLLERLLGHPIAVARGPWRPGDQRIYVSDIRKAARELSWQPKVRVAEGIARLYKWVVENRLLFQ
jgi:CDP-paratose 2-epimerase